MTKKPSIPKGTRDFSPAEMIRRDFIFDTIKEVFKLYGYLPVETPAMETLSTLTGKCGEEGDKLLFKILNSGDYLSKLSSEEIQNTNLNKLTPRISEKGLRFDLTVPFARYVVQHKNDITFPFKRYQIQPVWRADRPQKGRYREFYQCDVDVIGSDSILNEVELVQIIDQIFSRMAINSVIKINNRKILSGIAEIIGEADKIVDITVTIDKLDRIGIEQINEELASKGIPLMAIAQLQPIIGLSGTTDEKLTQLKKILQNSKIGLEGIDEMEMIFDFINNLSIKTDVELDLTLARGLDYYTGVIIEVISKDYKIGSICGGGRYDDLAGVFGLPGVSGVGISFGADRIYDVLDHLDLFPKDTIATTKLMFVNFGRKEEKYCLPILAMIRGAGISSEIYPEPAKIKKQMIYANQKKISFVALIGENEINEGVITIKNMINGEQKKMTVEELIIELK